MSSVFNVAYNQNPTIFPHFLVACDNADTAERLPGMIHLLLSNLARGSDHRAHTPAPTCRLKPFSLPSMPADPDADTSVSHSIVPSFVPCFKSNSFRDGAALKVELNLNSMT